ncbi:NBR1-Ig-like domain-containing protein [Amycolatopsis sp. H20-H5]|uniref:NBR1-Ig-like domain-containing protein n=1 Tax=Amycolatopsis sp. H20-H5 TaxID=3046309 RepID=UPI002DBE6BD9|nr:NBR1-Ig-like domain-containing protein [Amycolatopsis sp. H20-H5]MEC3978150.1 NBR1-Ig-like domain-containing protein [Amycolatopsis sp. H20-H5]
MSSENDRVVLAHQLRYHRKLAGTSLSTVAKALGRSVSHLSNVETGRDRASWEVIAFYDNNFHADGQLWTAWVEVMTAARPPQRVSPGQRPDYPLAGDAGTFVADVTIPDGTIMPPLFIFEKIWRIKNSGTVPWVGRRLARVGAAAGYGIPHSPSHVALADTPPGATVDIAVPIRAQPLLGTSQARWKMVDENGWEYFPDRYPAGVFMTIVVVEGAPSPDLRHWA